MGLKTTVENKFGPFLTLGSTKVTAMGSWLDPASWLAAMGSAESHKARPGEPHAADPGDTPRIQSASAGLLLFDCHGQRPGVCAPPHVRRGGRGPALPSLAPHLNPPSNFPLRTRPAQASTTWRMRGRLAASIPASSLPVRRRERDILCFLTNHTRSFFTYSLIIRVSYADTCASVVAPARPGWEEKFSSSRQRVYYYEKKTGTSTWFHPNPKRSFRGNPVPQPPTPTVAGGFNPFAW